MKSITKIFAIATLVFAMASCSNDRAETELFSIDIPSGYGLGDDVDVPLQNIQIVSADKSSAITVMVYPFDVNTETVLYNQTIGGGNPSLRGMSFEEITKFETGDVSGYKIEMEGYMDGLNLKALGYSFMKDGCSFLLFSFDENKDLADVDEEVIRSIKVNEQALAEYDSAKLVDYVVDLGRTNLPTSVDDVTTWTAINVDHNAKELVLVMTLDGTADDYENIGVVIESLQPGMAQQLKESRESDLLIQVPSDEGYTLGYDYVTEDGTTVGSIRIPASDLK